MAARRRKPLRVWYQKYMEGFINKLWQWSPERKKVKARALVPDADEDIYICEKCGTHPLKKGEYEINHILPRMPVEGFTTWDDYINRALCDADGAELLCKPCHKLITKGQNVERRLLKKEKGKPGDS